MSCSKTQSSETNIDVVVTEGEMNTIITVTAPNDCNTFQINDLVCLVVQLMSSHQVIFHTDAVGIFEYKDGQWTPLNNGNIDPPITYILYPNDNVFRKTAMFSTQPKFENRIQPVLLRFFVFGNFYDDDILGEEISAYTDVTLYP
jgi:hypothetical protein